MAIVCWLEAGILGGISIWVVRNELAEGRIERRDGEKRRKNNILLVKNRRGSKIF
jgi:hypothetical protein